MKYLLGSQWQWLLWLNHVSSDVTDWATLGDEAHTRREEWRIMMYFLISCAWQIFLADICFELVHCVLFWVGLNYRAQGYPFIIPSKCKSNTSGSISWHHSTSRKRESDNNWDKDECKQRILLTMTMTMEILTIATSQMKTRLCLKWSTAIYKYKFNTNQFSHQFDTNQSLPFKNPSSVLALAQ